MPSWTGACNGQGATCTLTIQAATSTNAVFGGPAADDGTDSAGNTLAAKRSVKIPAV